MIKTVETSVTIDTDNNRMKVYLGRAEALGIADLLPTTNMSLAGTAAVVLTYDKGSDQMIVEVGNLLLSLVGR